MRLLRAIPGPLFVLAGALHLVRPRLYEAIMPDYLPAHRELVAASGVAEMLGGAGLIAPATRRAAGWWLMATLVAVFPANVWMAQHPERYRVPGGRVALLARLPLQLVVIAWVRAAARR
ncbi:MAG: hypothetical protein QOD81_3409 [Solirubrobacteraceae bacterium]|jgi:uncharacterized membrane protein|nr:hypothetical protein [Solirubrobacteraceae bacterium]